MDDSGLLAQRLIALEARVARLEGRRAIGPVDKIGAPVLDWPALREAVKQTISEIGLDETARRYGATPETFRDLIYRRRAPGAGARARLAVVIGGKTG